MRQAASARQRPVDPFMLDGVPMQRSNDSTLRMPDMEQRRMKQGWSLIFLLLALAVGAASAGPPQPFVAVGSYSNFRFTKEHQYGAGVDLWRDGSTLIGLFSYSAGLAGDTPTGRLEHVSFDPNTGRISFTARLTMGQHVCKVHDFVPSQDVYKFSGVLADRSLVGTLRHTDNLHPERAPTEERVVLLRSNAEPVIQYGSREQWESAIGAILKFRGPRW